jgi:hypothetical protein
MQSHNSPQHVECVISQIEKHKKVEPEIGTLIDPKIQPRQFRVKTNIKAGDQYIYRLHQ